MVERTVSQAMKGRPSPSRFLLAGSAGQSVGAGLCTSGEFGFLTVTLLTDRKGERTVSFSACLTTTRSTGP